jgi:hypothetical protein
MTDLNAFVMLIYAMQSCNERTTLHCVESYLYHIILVDKKKYVLRSETREKINRQYTYIVENIRVFLTCFAASGNELYILRQYTYIVSIVVCQKLQRNCQIV